MCTRRGLDNDKMCRRKRLKCCHHKPMLGGMVRPIYVIASILFPSAGCVMHNFIKTAAEGGSVQ